MSTKQANKKAKRAAVSKQKRKAANVQRNLDQFHIGRREMARIAVSPEGIEASEARLRYDIATKGVIQTALDLKKDPKKATAELNNIEVLKGINDMIPILGNIHGVIEVTSKLVDMKKTELTVEEQSLVDIFDKQIVSVAEDVHAMFEFINKEQEVDEYISLFVHYTDTLAEIMQFNIPELMESVLRPRELLINEYVREHMHEGESNYEFGMRLHGERITRVEVLYRTVPAATEPMPTNKPLVGDLVDEDAYEDIGAKQVN
jgi:hypothetical protein